MKSSLPTLHEYTGLLLLLLLDGRVNDLLSALTSQFLILFSLFSLVIV